MNISVLTVFSQLYDPFLQTSLVRLAQEKGIVHFDVERFFSYVAPKERIDASTFGPGVGMLIKPTVVQMAVEDKEKKYGTAYKIFFSPQGQKLDQRLLEVIAQKAQEKGHLMLLAARYEGMDARVEHEYADMIVSIGDFIVMGGDLPAMMLLEGMLRLIPGVVGKEESVRFESFTGPFVDYPSYTQPVSWKGHNVPDIVRSGNHAAIEAWRMQQAAQKTVKQHFSWIRSQQLTNEQRDLAKQHIPPHYVALLHSDVLVGESRTPGATSVTSLDMHDIARSARTYGVENFFVVTPLVDQQKIVRRLLDFWQVGVGQEYNKNRYEAVKKVRLENSIDEVMRAIEKKEGKQPLVIATSARLSAHKRAISFYDQSRVWAHDRPVLLIFGTGKGLTPVLIERCDYILYPAHGFSDFNHLSVRSAVAIVLDRWLGINEKALSVGG